MYYKYFFFVSLVVLLFTRFQCSRPKYPGLIEVDLLVTDKDGSPVVGAPLYLSREGCALDTFRSDENGKASYSFLPDEDETEMRFSSGYYQIGVLSQGFTSDDVLTFINSGKYSAEFVAQRALPLLSVTVKASEHDSILLFRRRTGLFYCAGNSSVVLPLDTNFYRIQDPSIDFNATIWVPENDTSIFTARIYDALAIRDTLLEVVVEEELVDWVLEL